MKIKVILTVNSTWNIFNFRVGLVNTLVKNGYEVIVLAPIDEYASRIQSLNCKLIPLRINTQGTNLGSDLLLFWRYYRFLRRERPAILLSYTIKPNIYGSLAAHVLGIPVINNIAGLGVVFIKNSWLTFVVRVLYRLSLSRSKKVFFQNLEDQRLFIDDGIVRPEITDRLPGSGVDLSHFSVNPSRTERENLGFQFILIGRMLWDKGIGEFIAAARLVRKNFKNIEFSLLGFLDVENPSAISKSQMDEWVEEGIVNYIGVTDDIRPFLNKADCVVLPSFYREGVPRSLLEAAAMGCPIITTDSIGCREVVDDGVNGFLCEPRNAIDLAEKMTQMLKLSNHERIEMGRQGRKKIELEFDEKIVLQKYLDAIRKLEAE